MSEPEKRHPLYIKEESLATLSPIIWKIKCTYLVCFPKEMSNEIKKMTVVCVCVCVMVKKERNEVKMELKRTEDSLSSQGKNSQIKKNGLRVKIKSSIQC